MRDVRLLRKGWYSCKVAECDELGTLAYIETVRIRVDFKETGTNDMREEEECKEKRRRESIM